MSLKEGPAHAGPTTPVTLGITTSSAVEAAVLAGERCAAAGGPGQALDALLARVQDALARAQTRVEEIGLVAVCIGPGSFTGLRIGVAFAKGFAQARELPLVGVTTFDVVEQTAGVASVAVVEGKRGFYYARVREAGEIRYVTGDVDALSAAGIDVSRQTSLPAGEAAQRVARIGRRLYEQGAPADWRVLALEYGQRPTAEANWERRRMAEPPAKRHPPPARET